MYLKKYVLTRFYILLIGLKRPTEKKEKKIHDFMLHTTLLTINITIYLDLTRDFAPIFGMFLPSV